MKVKKVYEDISENKKAKKILGEKLARKLARKFFYKTIGFNRVYIDYNIEPNILNFYFVFDSISPLTIKSLEALLLYFGWNKDGWGLQISDVGSDMYRKAFYEVHLSSETINKYLEKFELEENSKKYNI